MALTTLPIREQYSGNGTSTNFSFPYYFLTAADLNVYLVDEAGTVLGTPGAEFLQTITSQYTLVGLYNPLTSQYDDYSSGASVNFVTAPATGYTVVILRNNAETQSTSFTQNSLFSSKVVETTFDKVVMLIQYLMDRSSRSLRLTDANPQGITATLPNPLIANNVIAVNSNATGFTQTPMTSGTQSVTQLAGDVTSPAGPGTVTTTVVSVGGSTAANVHAAELLANAAVSTATINTIVKRDGSANFSAGTITANLTGNVTGNVTGNTSGTSGSFTGSLTGDVTSTGMATTVAKINGTSLASLGTGILKNTTSTGVPSIAVAADFPTLNQNTSGNAATATTATSATSATTAASVSGTNVITNTNLSQMPTVTIKGNNTGGTANAADLTVAQVNTMLGSLSNPMTTPGDIIYGGTAGLATRLATASGVLIGGATPSYSTTPTLTGTNITNLPLAGLAAAAYATAATASTLAERDANANLTVNNSIEGFSTAVTAAQTVTTTITSPFLNFYTGTSTATHKLPTTSVPNGYQQTVVNLSTAAVTVQSSGANTITTMAANTQATFTALVATPTTAANWSATYSALGTIPVALGGTGLTTLTANNLLLGAGTSTPTFLAPGASGNVPTSNGTIWQSVAGGSSPTASYAQAFHINGNVWTTTGASYGALTHGVGTATLTVRNSSGITLTAAAASAPGITFTPAASTAIYLVTAEFSDLGDGNFHYYRFSDGTVNFGSSNTGGGAGFFWPLQVSGIYVPGTASAVTVQIQGATGAGTLQMNSASLTLGSSIEWTVVRIF